MNDGPLCDRQVYIFGSSTVLAEGVREPGANDFASRMNTYFVRACGAPVKFEVVAEQGGTLVDALAAIADRIARSPRSIVLLHFPFTDIEGGASVEQLLRVYRTILDACAKVGSTCIVGGQQPVNAFSQEVTDRQFELERRATAAFGLNYLSIYRYLQSESSGRRLMLPLDAGDGRFLHDFGHEVLYMLYLNRLLEMTGLAR